MKTLEASKNSAGGYDLVTERDSGNFIRCLTGRYADSLQYWKRIKKLAEAVIDELENVDESHHEETIVNNTNPD